MHTYKWTTYVILLTLLVALLPFAGSVESVEAQKVELKCSSPEQLREIVDEHIALEVKAGAIPAWENGIAGSPTTYYNLQGGIEAYELPVMVNKGEHGYVVVQASTCQIVEFADSPSPYRLNTSTAQNIANAWELELESYPLYLSPFDKFFVLKSVNRWDSNQVLLNMEDYSFFILGKDNELVPQLFDGKELNLPDFVPTACDSLQTKPVSYTRSLNTLAAKQLSVPVYHQFCYGSCYVGCTPTAGGTLMSYWDKRGFASLISGGDYKSAIRSLNNRAGTTCCGGQTACGNPGSGCTYFSKLTPAMEGYASAKGYSNFNSTYYSGSSATYTRFKNQINNDRPLVVNFSANSPPYDYKHGHSNTGIGYDTANGNYMILQTNLSSVGTKRVLYGSSYGPLSFNTLVPPDTTPPIINFNIPNENRWYNIDKEISWSVVDSQSGVDYFKWAWDDDTPDNQVDDDSGSTKLSDVGLGQHTLYVHAWNKLGFDTFEERGWFGYDTTIPTATMHLNDGAPTTQQATVHLNLSAGDTWSGVAQVRISNNGVYWSDWLDYADVMTWGLPAIDGATLTVYVQVRDYAGNESAIVSDTITLDLYPVAPHSADYRICEDALLAGGTVGLTGTGYVMHSAIGQPIADGAGLLSGTGCRPITRAVPSPITLTQQVIAAGGGLRSNANHRLGDTTGETFASGTNAFVSADYILSSGFWGHVTEPTCDVPVESVSISGPTNGYTTGMHTFQATVTPTNATTPVSYAWSPAPDTGQGTTEAVYTWATTGTKTVTFTASNCGEPRVATHTIAIEALPPSCLVPLQNVSIEGPIGVAGTLYIGSLYTFRAITAPIDATPPVTYTWSPTPISGQDTAEAGYRWNTPNVYTIELTAESCGGTLRAAKPVTIADRDWEYVYLPLVLRGQ